MNRRRELLQKLVHMLTAFTITMKAVVKLEHPAGYWPVIVLFCAAAIYIVVITILHERLHHRARMVDASVYAIEFVVMAAIAALTFREGARCLPYLYIVSAVGFAVAFALRLKRDDHPDGGRLSRH